MATLCTSQKTPGFAVKFGQDGMFVELHDGMVKVSPNGSADIEQMVLDQFKVIDPSIIWNDLDSEIITSHPPLFTLLTDCLIRF